METLHQPDPEEVNRFFWEQGFLRHLLHPDLQSRVYDFTHEWKDAHPNSALPIVWDLHRAAGKTYMLCLLCVERGMKWPAQEIRFGAETEGKCLSIVEPNFRRIFESLPDGFRAEYKNDQRMGPYYELWNPTWPEGSYPSRIWVIGCRERADIHRGKRSHMIVLDECREIDAFEYVAKVVFGPHFATMDFPIYIMSSTPPESMDHAWSRVYCREAREAGRYFVGPVTDNADWTPNDDERMLELFKSKDSSDWQREMLCHHISDPTRLLVPEFDEKFDVVEEWTRPQHLIPLVVCDGGYVDFFACHFGYIDFPKNLLVVEDALVMRRLNTGRIAEEIRNTAEHLFGEAIMGKNGPQVVFPVRPQWSGDLKPREIADLGQIYHLPFTACDNSDPDAKIATLRDYIFRHKVKVYRHCEALIDQLKNAVRDEKGKLTRSEAWGHWDAVMALAYMVHVAPWNRNPGFEQPVPFDWTKQQIPKGAFREEFKGTTRRAVRGTFRKRW